MYPIIIYEKGAVLPEEGSYYLVTKNGIFLRKETGLIASVVPVSSIGFLQEIKPWVKINVPKIPSVVVAKALLFFRRVFDQLHSEAAVLIHYQKETKTFELTCPEQEVTGGSVRYKASDRLDGFQLVGTIHSHCDFGAFHSGVDIGDEVNFDGIHITIGNVDRPYFTISCSGVVNSHRVKYEPENCIIGCRKVDYTPPTQPVKDPYRRPDIKRGLTERLLDARERAVNTVMDVLIPLPETGGLYTHYTPPVQQYYDLVLPEGMDYRHIGTPVSWLQNVRRPVYTAPVTTTSSAQPQETSHAS